MYVVEFPEVIVVICLPEILVLLPPMYLYIFVVVLGRCSEYDEQAQAGRVVAFCCFLCGWNSACVVRVRRIASNGSRASVTGGCLLQTVRVSCEHNFFGGNWYKGRWYKMTC